MKLLKMLLKKTIEKGQGWKKKKYQKNKKKLKKMM